MNPDGSAASVSIGGTYTALVTPTVGRGAVDEGAWRALLDWQSDARVDGVVVGGTTGESPTLSEAELARLFETARAILPGRVDVVAATGRNHLEGTLALSGAAVDVGIRRLLIVDPYYNGPSSLEIRKELYEPLAARFPSASFLPYVIPGRTGTRLDPVDVARLVTDGRPIAGLKDATGDDAYARELRHRCPDLSILSGDDARTFPLMADPTVRASGVISVVSNLVPEALTAAVARARSGDPGEAARRAAPLQGLFDSVTVRVAEPASDGGVQEIRSRNPVPIKTALALLGVPVGACRPPLGRMSLGGVTRLRETLRTLHRADPTALAPLATRFGVDIDRRLDDPELLRRLSYERL